MRNETLTPASSETIRVLHVEDDDDHARLLRSAVKGAGAGVDLERVRDGTEAMAYLRGEQPFEDRRRPDVVLLDLMLPGIDGYEVLEAVKADEALRMIPVVVLTTSDTEADRHRAYGLHANSYLVKPGRFEQLREMVEDLRRYWGIWHRSPFDG